MSTVPNSLPIDTLRLYIIDRLGAPVLHDLRNAVQAVLGHTALLHAQLSGMVSTTDLPSKLQLAAERCGRGTVDFNIILSPPAQRHHTTRLNGLLREHQTLLQSLLKDRKALNIQLCSALDAVRVQQQPLCWLVLLWMIRARDYLPPGTHLLLKTEPVSETSPLSGDKTRIETDALVRLDFEDDGPNLSMNSQAQLETPTVHPTGDPESFVFWLLGSVLREYHATASVQALTPGTRISVLWPKAATVVRPSPPLRNDERA